LRWLSSIVRENAKNLSGRGRVQAIWPSWMTSADRAITKEWTIGRNFEIVVRAAAKRKGQRAVSVSFA